MAGKFWDATPSTEPEVSIEEGMRGAAGLESEASITFDIQGRKIPARVTSIRHVDWRNSRTGFMVLLQTGRVGERAADVDRRQSTGLRRAGALALSARIVDSYPNISVIDVAEVVRNSEPYS